MIEDNAGRGIVERVANAQLGAEPSAKARVLALADDPFVARACVSAPSQWTLRVEKAVVANLCVRLDVLAKIDRLTVESERSEAGLERGHDVEEVQAGRTTEVEPVDRVNRGEKGVALGVDGQFEMLIAGTVDGDVMPMAVVQIDMRVNLIEESVGF